MIVRAMERHIEIGDTEVTYTVRESARAKRVSLTMHYDGRFVVTVPKGASAIIAERFIQEKKNWVLRNLAYLQQFRHKIFPYDDIEDFKRCREQALSFIKERIQYFNSFYGFQFNRVYVKNQKTQWGSCSAKKNLNFNYKLIHLPQELADYIIVHELCHLRELNHSKRFWNLVAQALPDYRTREKQLREYSII